MATNGFYYLTHDRDFGFSRSRPTQNVRQVWEYRSDDTKESALIRIAIEALALGADFERIHRLAYNVWGLTTERVQAFAKAVGIEVAWDQNTEWDVALGFGSGLAAGETVYYAFMGKFPNPRCKVAKSATGRTMLEALANLVKPGLYLSRNVTARGRLTRGANDDLRGAIQQ